MLKDSRDRLGTSVIRHWGYFVSDVNSHSADAAAAGFLYQAQYALVRLWKETSDEATIFLETLDDVVLEANGEVILEQLKHSLAEKPKAITISSVNLWKTIKAWIDVLPKLDLSKTHFHLVAVAEISPKSELMALLDEKASRDELLVALRDEAERVAKERALAIESKESVLPHADRLKACEAFRDLAPELQLELLTRAKIMHGQANITKIEDTLAGLLITVPARDRSHVAARMVEWWTRQIVHAHCKMREKAIPRSELVEVHVDIVGDIKNDPYIDYYATEYPPPSYQSHSMIVKQIDLVGGSADELRRSVENEWRARETRSRWAKESPLKRDAIIRYDARLEQEWREYYVDMRSKCDGQSLADKVNEGRVLLRWSHFEAHKGIEPIAPAISPTYLRGSYQVLSITGQVGWHPDFRKLLGFEE